MVWLSKFIFLKLYLLYTLVGQCLSQNLPLSFNYKKALTLQLKVSSLLPIFLWKNYHIRMITYQIPRLDVIQTHKKIIVQIEGLRARFQRVFKTEHFFLRVNLYIYLHSRGHNCLMTWCKHSTKECNIIFLKNLVKFIDERWGGGVQT